MAKAPVDTNGIDLDSDAPIGGDVALVGDASADGIAPGDEEEDENQEWDLPKGKQAPKPSSKEPDEFDEEDARIAYSDSDIDDGTTDRDPKRSKRAQRNARRREHRAAADAEIAALRNALNEQGEMIRSLVQGQGHLAVNTVASEIAQLEGHLRIAGEAMADAVKNSDDANFTKAQDIRDAILTKLGGLRAQKVQLDKATGGQVNAQESGPPKPPQQNQIDPRIARAVENYYDRFCDRHPWFDPDGSDADSTIVKAIDGELRAQGYQPHTPVYWQQLERTMASRYNLRADQADRGRDPEADDTDIPQRPAGTDRYGQRPPTAAARGARNGRAGFHLNAHQTSMLRDEGLLGDGLSKEDVAKRDRIIAAWKKGAENLRGAGGR